MTHYEKAMNMMAERFAEDSLIAMATTDGERLYNRIVNTCYEDGAFYISTHALTSKVKQATQYPEVAVCAVDWFSGHGQARNLGWALAPQNAALREKLRKVFSAWYDFANNEQDENCCFLEIRLTDGMLIKDHHAVRYQIDFTNQSALLSENGGEFRAD